MFSIFPQDKTNKNCYCQVKRKEKTKARFSKTVHSKKRSRSNLYNISVERRLYILIPLKKL